MDISLSKLLTIFDALTLKLLIFLVRVFLRNQLDSKKLDIVALVLTLFFNGLFICEKKDLFL
jgi:hypothetical protein